MTCTAESVFPPRRRAPRGLTGALFTASALLAPFLLAGAAVFNIRDYGASGRRTDDARAAIQQAIDAAAKAGGGTVYLPPGLYTSGTLHLRSHIHVELASGATLFAATDPKAFDYGNGTVASKAALFYGEDLEDVSVGGQGVVDGQAEYEWRPDDFERNFEHKTLMQKLGKSLMRSVPRGFPKREVFPHLVWLGRCKGIRMTGLSFLHAPSWTFTLTACERVVFDGLYIYTSLKEGVWADGIDLDGCKEVSIANCAIETGDDCVAIFSADIWGKAVLCENISITNCRFSSASAGLKFTEANHGGVRNVRVSNTLFNHVNRGVVFMTALGGSISDVTLENLTINCDRFDWFWAGDGQPFHLYNARISELDPQRASPDEAPPGAIRNLTIRNIVARAYGSSLFYGHAENWLEGLRLENIKLVLCADPSSPFDQAQHALDFRRVRDLRLKDVEVLWGWPTLDSWKSALNFEEVKGLEMSGVVCQAAPAPVSSPAMSFDRVAGALVRGCRALDNTRVFLRVTGAASKDIRLEGNDLARAQIPCEVDKSVGARTVSGVEVKTGTP